LVAVPVGPRQHRRRSGSIIYIPQAAWFVIAAIAEEQMTIKQMTTKRNSELQPPQQEVIGNPLLVKILCAELAQTRELGQGRIETF
jgi:hypothetical protein